MKNFVLFLFVGISITTHGQKLPLIDNYDNVVELAKQEIEQSMQSPDGGLFLFTQENGISGTYDFDITLHEKGLVATVFVKSNEGGTIQMQNKLKDYVKRMEFNFKMPKGKDYKFNHIFKF